MAKYITKITVALVIIIVGALFIGKWYSINKEDAELRNLYAATIKHNKELKSAFFKIVTQQSSILSKYADDFHQNIPKLFQTDIQGTQQSSGPMPGLLAWIQAKVPEYSPEMYKNLTDKVEAFSLEFVENQKKLHDIKMKHDNVVDDPFAQFFLKNKTRLQDVVVVTARTDQEFKTGIDSDTTGLFKE